MKTIYLIGFMGSGKSTIGHHLAIECNVSFIDTDDYIEHTYNQRISEIFAYYGEDTFRTYEIAALKDVSTYSIVATGGGIVEREQNKDTMKNGTVIYLATPFNEIVQRLKGDDSRPLWQHTTDQQKRLFDKRVLLYELFADEVIQTANKCVHVIVQEIISLIKE